MIHFQRKTSQQDAETPEQAAALMVLYLHTQGSPPFAWWSDSETERDQMYSHLAQADITAAKDHAYYGSQPRQSSGMIDTVK